MTKYRITKMNTGFGNHVFSLNMVDKYDGRITLKPTTPIRYYKTEKTAKRKALKMGWSLD